MAARDQSAVCGEDTQGKSTLTRDARLRGGEQNALGLRAQASKGALDGHSRLVSQGQVPRSHQYHECTPASAERLEVRSPCHRAPARRKQPKQARAEQDQAARQREEAKRFRQLQGQNFTCSPSESPTPKEDAESRYQAWRYQVCPAMPALTAIGMCA